MNERIRQLRKELGLTLEKFGEQVGVGKTAISKIERGENGVTEQMFKTICREFNVNEEWLRTGEGEMFSSTESEYGAIVDRIMAGENEFAKSVVKTFTTFDEKDWEALHRMIKKFNTPEVISSLKTASLFNDVPKTAEELEKKYPPVEESKNDKNNAG